MIGPGHCRHAGTERGSLAIGGAFRLDMKGAERLTSGLRRRGYAFVELLVVLCIVGSLSAVALEHCALGSARSARQAVRDANLRKLRDSVELFASVQGDYPPTLRELTQPFPAAPGRVADWVGPILSAIPECPGGSWGYDGRGNVWVVEAPGSGGASHHPVCAALEREVRKVPSIGHPLQTAAGALLGLAQVLPVALSWMAALGLRRFSKALWLGLRNKRIGSRPEACRALSGRLGVLSALLGERALDSLLSRLRDCMYLQYSTESIPLRRSDWIAAGKAFVAVFGAELATPHSSASAPTEQLAASRPVVWVRMALGGASAGITFYGLSLGVNTTLGTIASVILAVGCGLLVIRSLVFLRAR
jgi:type II secretory pathway pseudopilin PulG